MKKSQHKRPDIASITRGDELKRWYWLKSELVAHARVLGVKTTGQKFTLLERIAHFLDTGETQCPGDREKRVSSSFDWHAEVLTPDTVITDSYRNSQNVRRFFKQHADPGFKFNIEFMAWMRANAGKTLADAAVEYQNMREREKTPGFKSRIAHHNQFNQYTRDFLEDNPDMGMEEVRKYWALKRALPSQDGRHIYERSDLDLERSDLDLEE